MGKKTLSVIFTLLLGLQFRAGAEVKEYGTSSPSASALFATGIGLMEVYGLVMRPLILTRDYEKITSYLDYTDGTGSGYDYFDSDSDKLVITSFGLWSTGALFAAAPLLFPPEELTISVPGKIGMILGLGLSGAGALLDLISANRLADSDYYFSLYEGAHDDLAGLYGQYETAFSDSRNAAIIGMSLRGAGGLITALSLILPGEKKPLASTPLHKLLYGGAIVLITGGIYAKHAAAVQALRLNSLYDDYTRSAGNPGEVYAEYERIYTGYAAAAVLSYGFFIAGGAAAVTALFIPQREVPGYSAGSGAADVIELSSFSLIPGTNGDIHFGIGLAF